LSHADTLHHLNDLRALAGKDARLMGLDLGTKTIGMALSDVSWRIASPLDTIIRKKFTIDIEQLRILAEKFGIAAFVIGLPLDMNGKEGPRVQSTRSFVRLAEPLLKKPFLFWDERLSTQAMERMLIAADTSRAKRDAVIDKMAAAYILQGALDGMEEHHFVP
jgi:putative holliday junction resolvase